MISGLGIDVVDVERVARALERRPGSFERRIFTDSERERCNRRRSPRGRPSDSRAEAFAARWAAKEAFFKAIGRRVGWREVGVRSLRGGRPVLDLSGRALRALGERTPHVSLTHDGKWAAAVVVLEGAPPKR